jgi:DHA1 family tetracycline resistance protein-like MFS transporter
LALAGVGLEIAGFGLVIAAIQAASVPILFAALLVIVSGFSCMQPSVNALVSRHSDPEHQGVVLGVTQSVNAMARILGSAIAIPLLRMSLSMPYVASAGLMALAAIALYRAGRIPFPK